MKKLFIVRKEVLATSIEKAVHGRGKTVYVELADEKFQPVPVKKSLGFKNKNK